MSNFLTKFINGAKGLGKWAALIAVVITVISFAADELSKWQLLHDTAPELKKKPAVTKEKADVGPDADTSIEEQITE